MAVFSLIKFGRYDDWADKSTSILMTVLYLFVLTAAVNVWKYWHIACSYNFTMKLTHCLLAMARATSHHLLAQGGRSSVDFVAFDHIRCCGQPHRDRLKKPGEQGQTIPYITISTFGSTTINRSAINLCATQYPSLNTFL